MCNFKSTIILLTMLGFNITPSLSKCKSWFDKNADIYGGAWISVSKEVEESSKNGLFCAVRERSVIDYHISKAQEYNYNEKINWKLANCSSNNELAFNITGRTEKRKIYDPWTEEQYFISILCASPSQINFTFVGVQSMQTLLTLEDYDMDRKRFRLTVTIPYDSDRTGNYSFHTGNITHESQFLTKTEEWFHIHLKDFSASSGGNRRSSLHPKHNLISNFIPPSKKISTWQARHESLGCPILKNTTWDYASNVYAVTVMESELLKKCLYKDENCAWNSNWDTNGERVFGDRKNKRIVDCKNDPLNYPCSFIDMYPSGFIGCIKNDNVLLEEQYFTGLDRKIYLVRDLVSNKVSIDSLARITLEDDLASAKKSKEFYSDQLLTLKCASAPFIIIPGFTWSSIFKNGSVMDYPSFPTKEWAGREKSKGEREERFYSRFSSKTVAIMCNFFQWNVVKPRSVTIPVKIKDKSTPIFHPGETNVKITTAEKTPILHCTVFGVPTPTLDWFKGDEKLESVITTTNENEVRAELRFNTGNKSSLQVESGEYYCKANNSEGAANQTFTVNLEDVVQEGSIWAIVVPLVSGIIFLAFIAVLAVYIVYRKRYVILTKEDLERFKNGDALKLPETESPEEFNFKSIAYNEEYEVSNQSYDIDFNKILGSGEFGLVLKGSLDGKEVAVKTIKSGVDRESLLSFLDEIKVMIYLGPHPNIVELLGCDTTKLQSGKVYLFVEFCPLGSVLNYLRDKSQQFKTLKSVPNAYENVNANEANESNLNEKKLLIWSYQIARGMQFLESKKVIHGDLAARNILLLDTNTVKITDFGLSKQLQNYSIYKKTKCQPLPWRSMSIEALEEMIFSSKSDVWSFGVTVWEMYSLGAIPYSGLGWDITFPDRLRQGLRLLKPALASDEIFALMEKCWWIEPEDRPEFSYIEGKLRAILTQNEGDSPCSEYCLV